tara:strand:+ start:60 stop:185 length:126 start_codon:yes stop_codon:yes gene_type:complete
VVDDDEEEGVEGVFGRLEEEEEEPCDTPSFSTHEKEKQVGV